jgi:asparagine synthase (glutamine-hydrolysing)
MCGIAGRVNVDVPVDPSLIGAMCSAIEHRGPDSRGIFLDGAVGLGIQRLAVIDLESGDQPIFNEDESVVVVLNGEIYNYVELRDELESRGHRFRTRSDTEVIAHLYEERGDACVERLRGMFAFALWDARAKRLLLARDRIGKKPLFYCHKGDSFWFASEPKAILQDPEVPRDPDYAALDSFLQWGYVPHPQSAFAALRKLPPAHTLVLQSGTVALSRYWKLSYEERVHGSDLELQELVREQLLEATRIRLRSDVPLGAFLSGGVDSSAIVAAMAQLSSATVKTFSIGFSSDWFDETPYAREVAQLFATDHHEYRVEPHAIELLPKLVWHYGEPFADQSAIPSFCLSEVTRREVTVALNGDGGDESFGGYQRYIANAIAARLDWIPAQLARAAVRLARLDGTTGAMNSSRSRVARLLTAAGMPEHERYAAWMSVFAEGERETLYTSEFGSTVDTRDALGVLTRPYLASDAGTHVERLLDVDVQSWLTDDLLVKMDIASMAHSLEVRSPLLDHVFMEMAASLPASAKIDRRNSKRLLKDAVRCWLPDHILDRPKHGFGVPLADWLRGELRQLPATVLLDRRALDRGMFRRSAVEKLISDHLDRKADNSNRIWALVQLELWFQTFIDGGGHDGPVEAAPSSAAVVDVS